jgi:large subunit ribosomal protein L10
LAITKKHKNELIDQYSDWISRSKALVVAQYTGMSMKEIDALRTKVRESGGEFHVLKNTLAVLTFQKAGLKVPDQVSRAAPLWHLRSRMPPPWQRP